MLEPLYVLFIFLGGFGVGVLWATPAANPSSARKLVGTCTVRGQRYYIVEPFNEPDRSTKKKR